MQTLERLLQSARQLRQAHMAHGGGPAGERMRPFEQRRVCGWLGLFEPLQQSARPVVGLGQKNVEQVEFDAQRPDLFERLVEHGRQLQRIAQHRHALGIGRGLR